MRVNPWWGGCWLHGRRFPPLVCRVCLTYLPVCVPLQMVSNVDGHTWALCAVEEERPSKVLTLQNKEHIPITDSPVVVQQHNIPPLKFVLLSAKVESQLTNCELNNGSANTKNIFCIFREAIYFIN